MIKKMKEFVCKSLQVKYYSDKHDITASNILVSFALQRSGQHLVIEWICRGFLSDIIHFNHCYFLLDGLCASLDLTPFVGRRVIYTESGIDDSGNQYIWNLSKSLPDNLPKNIFYTVEDLSPDEYLYQRIISESNPTVILILRDPANWLASSIRHRTKNRKTLKSNIETFKKILEIATQDAALLTRK